MPSMMRAVTTLGISILRSCAAFFRTREEQAIVELALRQQLAVYAQRHPRPRISPLDRAFWVALSRRDLPKSEPNPDCHQRWMTFLRNHRDLITGMDFFVVPNVRFQLLYVWFVIDHGRRRVLHFNVTESPTACWVIQQLRDAFPNDPAHHFLVLDNDAIFSAQVAA
jgi:hypothetical protein